MTESEGASMALWSDRALLESLPQPRRASSQWQDPINTSIRRIAMSQRFLSADRAASWVHHHIAVIHGNIRKI